IGSLALIGTPFFSGFYSKESIIEAVHLSNIPGAGFAYFAVVAGVFITAFYSFRMYFLVFHGKERFGKDNHHHDDHKDEEDSHDHHHGLAPGQKPHETPWVVTVPLILLAIPSVFIGYFAFDAMLYGEFFGDAIFVAEQTILSGGVEIVKPHEEVISPVAMALHAFSTLPFWLAVAGVASAAFFYLKRPDIPAAIQKRFKFIYTLLDNNYYFDKFYYWFFAGGARGLSQVFWKFGDVKFIDGLLVNGSAKLVGMISGLVRRLQSGYIYHYAFSMIIGVFVLLSIRNWF
ncbi:MAG: NADH-quinone oxidoreductase subunit L, partial [Gallionella sp.]